MGLRTMLQVHGRGINMGVTRSECACFQFPTGIAMLISFKKKCDRRHPPGRKVYQRGAHTIWEVDGAKEKVRQLNDH